MWILIILAVLFIILLVTNVRVVPQATEFVIERLGTYYTTWETGLHFKVPLVDRVAKRISLKEQVMDFAPQPVITKDNVTMQIDTIVFYQVTDAKLYTYGVERPILAIESLTATTLRNIPDLPRRHQQPHHLRAGPGDRQMGHQGEPRGAEEHRSSAGYSGRDGEADARRA